MNRDDLPALPRAPLSRGVRVPSSVSRRVPAPAANDTRSTPDAAVCPPSPETPGTTRQDPRPERPSASQGMRHSPAADVPAPPLEQRALTAMIRARADLVLRQPFFGSLALHLALKPDSTCRHLWTDGRTLGFNPVWAATLPHERLVGAQAHEVMHLACAHHIRRNRRLPAGAAP